MSNYYAYEGGVLEVPTPNISITEVQYEEAVEAIAIGATVSIVNGFEVVDDTGGEIPPPSNISLADLVPGRNVGIKPTDVIDLNVNALLAERGGFAAGVIGGLNGDVFIVDTLADSGPTSVRAALESPDPLWIIPIVSGVVYLSDQVQVESYKTLDCRIGILNFDSKRLLINDKKEIILCNFGIRNSDNDGIRATMSDMIWFHHLSLNNCADGLIDITRAKEAAFTARHTVSWCKFVNHNKCTISGLHKQDAPYDAYIQTTYNNNRMQCVQRMPRIAQSKVHAYNNVILFSQTGMASHDKASLLAERNWIEATSSDKVGMFYRLAPYTNGRIKSVGNVFSNGAKGTEYGASGVFDPPYPYTAQAMNSSLKDQILANAGATMTL